MFLMMHLLALHIGVLVSTKQKIKTPNQISIVSPKQ